MSTLSAIVPKLRLALVVGLLCVTGLTCRGLPNDDGSPTSTPEANFPSGEFAFVYRRCEYDNATVLRLTLPDREITPILSDQHDNRQLAWSPDGRMIGVLSYATPGRDLRVIDAETQEVRLELPGSFLQFAWSADDNSIFYLDREGNLYLYDLMSDESEHVTDGVSSFSVSPNGQWLGLSKRDSTHSAYLGYFVFRVLDLSDGRLLTTPYHSDLDDVGRLGANRSVWSPTANEVAVLFGAGAAQESKVVIYTVHEDHLQIKAMAVARETCERDYGEDLISVGFYSMAWSPDGRKLLVIRSETDARTGGEVLLFDSNLSDYQRLPFRKNTTGLVWTMDRWLVYVTGSDRETGSSSCAGRLRGEIWLADMETLETRVLVTDTLFIERPVWRP